jgi:uncharacterized protein YraI
MENFGLKLRGSAAFAGVLALAAAMVTGEPSCAQQDPSSAQPNVEAPAGMQPSPPAAVQSAPPRSGVSNRRAIAMSNMNMRQGPGTENAVIAKISGGSAVRVTSCSGEWCLVEWGGQTGYAIARNLDMSGRPRQYAQPYPGYGPEYVEGPVVYDEPPVYFYGPAYYGPTYYYYGGHHRRHHHWWR